MGPILRSLFLLMCLLISGCGYRQPVKKYTIGYDPTWFPIEVGAQDKQLLAFSIELLVEISKKENLSLSVEERNWDNILQGLREKQYDGALSTLRPYAFNVDRYTFSNLYLESGPVIVTPTKSDVKNVSQVQSKEVAIIPGSTATVLLQKYPGVLLRSYDSIPLALEAIVKEGVDVGVLNVLITQKYIYNLWKSKLQIASAPLTDEGIRLLTLIDEHPVFIKRFNRGLKAVKKKGIYQKLLKKWGLGPDGKEIKNIDAKLQALMLQLQKS